MKKQIAKTVFITVLTSTAANIAMAGNVTVNNENATSMTVKLIPEGAPKNFTLEKEVPANNTFKFDVSATELAGKSLFSLEGKANPFMGDKCRNLSIDKDYTVTFVNDTIGTTCIAHETTVN